MNNLWRGIILIVGSVFIFSVVIFRPEFLKSVRRSGSKYHLSRLGAASCGVFLLAIGIAGILNGLAMLSGVYVESIFVLAITNFPNTGSIRLLTVLGIFASFARQIIKLLPRAFFC
jgi:hypothetical protein